MLCAYHRWEKEGNRLYGICAFHTDCADKECDYYNAEYAERMREEKAKFQRITEATPPLNRIW